MPVQIPCWSFNCNKCPCVWNYVKGNKITLLHYFPSKSEINQIWISAIFTINGTTAFKSDYLYKFPLTYYTFLLTEFMSEIGKLYSHSTNVTSYVINSLGAYTRVVILHGSIDIMLFEKKQGIKRGRTERTMFICCRLWEHKTG